MIVQAAIEGQVQVGQRLRLDALRGVDEQHRALAGFQRAGHLVGEVDVAGGVDQVQDDNPRPRSRRWRPPRAAARSAP